jgi:hypothetical protein
MYIAQYKYCCRGNTAKLFFRIPSVVVNGIRWHRGIYRCTKCGEYTIRSETDDIRTFETCKVEFVDSETAQSLYKETQNAMETRVNAGL